ncbi:MAG: Uma2 family endonuclease [Candidatus Eremiobacteraeota bacterium]|jgi:Uma2 family endonuclease|nr:Uma2 family endonuclease [Candidatus Eremiobacteraeota bacterium]MCL5055563.1 Uma2 family endonuclease [Bacillota bacterium]
MSLARPNLEEKNLFNYHDYFLLPENGKRYQILEGELFMTPPPGYSHQNSVTQLTRILAHYLIGHPIGKVFCSPFAVVLSDINVVEPDLVYVSNANKNLIKERGIFGSPDLVVEVLSKGNKKMDRMVKFKLYAQFKVPHCWIVDPMERTIEVYELEEKEYQLIAKNQGSGIVSPSLFPGLEFSLKELWV